MHINPIQINVNYNFKKQNVQTGTKGVLQAQPTPHIMPAYAHYLSFMGGSSLNLKESIKNLDRLSDTKGGNFPPDIREAALEVLKDGNPADKTLIDIHKDKYALLKDCYDLDYVKSIFDEFSEVISDREADYTPDSFVAKVKNGEIENFNKDEDLAFQLLKLYWAEGFSLNDLREYSGTNLYHTLSKFNIPTMDRNYAHILKFSDKDYNERLTQQMTQKRMESMDRRVQKNEGEPVYIPRGPLSEAHKKHISQGLIKHYAEHPEKLSLMSQRQKEYFENNPEQKIIMQKVMDFAWNKTQEGRSVKKYMVKFFKKQRVALDDNVFSSDSSKMTKPQQEALKEFWKRNPWAKGHFSKAVVKGWENVKSAKPEAQKESAGIKTPLNLVPAGYVDDVKKWITKNAKAADFSEVFDSVKSGVADADTFAAFTVISDGYLKDNPEVADVLTSALGGALMSVKNEIRKGKLPEGISNNKDFLDAVALNIEDLFYPNGFKTYKCDGIDVPRMISYDEAVEKMSIITQISALHNQENFCPYLEKKINQSYEIMRRGTNASSKLAFLKFLGEDTADIFKPQK